MRGLFVSGFEDRMTYNLWQIERVAPDSIEHQVLQLVDGREEVVSEGRHGAGPKVVGEIHFGRSEAKSSMCLWGFSVQNCSIHSFWRTRSKLPYARPKGLQSKTEQRRSWARQRNQSTAPHRTAPKHTTQRNATQRRRREQASSGRRLNASIASDCRWVPETESEEEEKRKGSSGSSTVTLGTG